MDFLEKAGGRREPMAVLLSSFTMITANPIRLKMTAYKEEKDRIAKAACNEIQDGDTCFDTELHGSYV